MNRLGELAAWQVCEFGSMFGEVKVSPAEINPYRVEAPKSEALMRLEEWQAKRRWQVSYTPRG